MLEWYSTCTIPLIVPAALYMTAMELRIDGNNPLEHAEYLCRQQCSVACSSFDLDLSRLWLKSKTQLAWAGRNLRTSNIH